MATCVHEQDHIGQDLYRVMEDPMRFAVVYKNGNHARRWKWAVSCYKPVPMERSIYADESEPMIRLAGGWVRKVIGTYTEMVPQPRGGTICETEEEAQRWAMNWCIDGGGVNNVT